MQTFTITTLIMLHSKVRVYENLLEIELEEVLVSLRFGLQGSEMFVAAVLSHGQEGKFYTREVRLFKVERFLENFNNERCKQLIGVPKLFIFQACR